MMAFPLESVIAPTLVIFLITAIVSFYFLKSPFVAIGAAFLKSGIFFVYFCFYFDGTFTFLDDWTYFNKGRDLLARDIGVLNLPGNWDYVLMIGGGDHFLYYLYNAYAFRLFGEYYFSPVACNVLITVLIAYFGSGLAKREFGISTLQSKWFYIFVLFHPDILAWSNVMNGKDVLVLFLHVVLLISVSLLYRGRIGASLLIFFPTVFMLFFLRFYVPLLFAASLLISALVYKKHITTYFGYGISGGLLILVIWWIGFAGIEDAFSRLREDMTNPLYGFVRMLVTPVPFNTEINYAFLNFPSLFHWLSLPLACFGIVRLFRVKSIFCRFFCIYFLSFMVLYAIYGELQGPRHRVQLDYAFAVFQFIGFLALMRSATLKTNPLSAHL